MIPWRVIEAKRDGEELDPGALQGFFGGYMDGAVDEYQMAAFLMAVYFRGLTSRELDSLTGVMIESGKTLDLAWLEAPRIDKHSTGGVGDKVSLVLAPLMAALGVTVPMMSGRGLGHTGGTLDKLEAIPGFRTDLSLARFGAVLGDVGCAMIGQTEEIAPLDRRLYALRSVTGTVPSIPLIATSIMSKKLAEDLTGLVLDVKVGEGAFISDPDGALELARTMVDIGHARSVPTVALLTAMDRPLGRAVGNALETAEAIRCLQGSSPPDLREVVVALAGEMALLGGVSGHLDEGRRRASVALDDGSALERFRRLVEVQGGDPGIADDPSLLPRAPEVQTFQASRGGVVRGIGPTALGYGVVELGGGRKSLGESIDPAVGFVLEAVPGDEVSRGDVLARVHARNPGDAARGLAALEKAFDVGDRVEERLPLLLSRVTVDGVEELA